MNGIKDLLGNVPYAAELYWLLRQKDSPTAVHMDLRKLKANLPGWVETARQAAPQDGPRKKIVVFGMISYWVTYSTLLSLSLAAQGHDVTLAFMPYSHWRKPEKKFDVRRQNAYILETLKPATALIKVISLFGSSIPGTRYPDPSLKLGTGLEPGTLLAQAHRDTQYSLLTEEIEVGSDLYNMRLERNRAMAEAAHAFLAAERPDVVITPNGSILEFGVLFQVAQSLGIPASTFEFGEQNYRMWLAQDDDVMRQSTTALWDARGSIPLTGDEWQQIRTMFEARQGARVWETFERTWQTADSKGAAQIKSELGLDDRPLVFLPTNVLGDSLTLGRQIFVGMTEWIRRTIRWFGEHPEYQLVVRIHPGEQIGWGPSTYELLRDFFPEFPANVRVLPADYKVNSYDLVDAARGGLVYTTTMGMEMAMIGKPVVVLGETHYRGKGFTHDPENWDSYLELLEGILASPETYAPDREKIDAAWTYAYRFFFEYPQPFPWHIQHFWECTQEWPLARVLSDEGRAKFGRTFAYLIGNERMFQSPVRD